MSCNRCSKQVSGAMAASGVGSQMTSVLFQSTETESELQGNISPALAIAQNLGGSLASRAFFVTGGVVASAVVSPGILPLMGAAMVYSRARRYFTFGGGNKRYSRLSAAQELKAKKAEAKASYWCPLFGVSEWDKGMTPEQFSQKLDDTKAPEFDTDVEANAFFAQAWNIYTDWNNTPKENRKGGLEKYVEAVRSFSFGKDAHGNSCSLGKVSDESTI